MNLISKDNIEAEDAQLEGRRRVNIPSAAPVLPVRNGVMYPGAVMPMAVNTRAGRRMLSELPDEDRVVVLVAQRDSSKEKPTAKDLYSVGVAAFVLKIINTDDESRTVVLHGLIRVRIKRIVKRNGYMVARIDALPDKIEPSKLIDALILNVRTVAEKVLELSPNAPDEAQLMLNNIDSPGNMADFLAGQLPINTAAKQEILETLDVEKRMRDVFAQLNEQLQVLELSSKIQRQVRSSINQSQREYFLNEQLKAIRKELGHSDELSDLIEEFREKIEVSGMPEAACKSAMKELDRFASIPQASPEHTVVRSYLDWMTDIPWSTLTTDKLDVKAAGRILNADHYGLDKVKQRILEYLAVRKLAPHSRGPILCFVGPPGVGKTSLGRSIARAMGRKFIRMSLGGVRDEAELRGHRRTYIGSMPGRVVQEIVRCGAMNPVFMLDEVDKLGSDFRGDPSSALLEILDPAQNDSFQDHYLNTPMDLSKVLFIATANYMGNIPPALRDRMEVIELPGYTPAEKLKIAKKYLVPRQIGDNGLTGKKLQFRDEAISGIIARYTHESGVRELERRIGAVCRSVAAGVAAGTIRKRQINANSLKGYLGAESYRDERAQRSTIPGVATGLFYTPGGGGVLFIEAACYEGSGRLELTGHLGDVMRESARAALTLVRARAVKLGIDPKSFTETDLHVHVPAGAVAKDGPSAGTAMATSIVSLLTGRAVKPDVAMTGEISLRGNVLPVGGLKFKLIAAREAGIGTVLLPKANKNEVSLFNKEVCKGLKCIYVSRIEDVLKNALQDASVAKRS